MGKTHKIEELPLHELFSILESIQATGGVLIKGSHGVGTVNWHQGEIVYAGVEASRLRLGERLVEEGAITIAQLRDVLQAQQRNKPWRPLGSLCLEKGYVTSLGLQLVVHRHLTALLSELLSWRQGIFRYEQGDVAISDPIALSFFDFLNYRAAMSPSAIELSWLEASPPASLWRQLLQEVEGRSLAWPELFGFTDAEKVAVERMIALQHLMRSGKLGQLSRPLMMDQAQLGLAECPGEPMLLLRERGEQYRCLRLSDAVGGEEMRLDASFFYQGRALRPLLVDDPLKVGGKVAIITLPCLSTPLQAWGVRPAAGGQIEASILADNVVRQAQIWGSTLNVALQF